MSDDQRPRITEPGYLKGRTAPNKGRKMPAEVLTAAEVERLMDALPKTGKMGVRNRAIVALMVRAGVKIGQIVELERYHYEPDARVVVVRVGKEKRRRMPLDAITWDLMQQWMETRRELKFSKMARLFGGVSEGSIGNPMWDAYLREMLHEASDKAGIEKRVTPSGLVQTYRQRTAERSQRIVSQLVAHIDETTFGARYPVAYEKWRMAFDLYELGAEHHATRIGHDCREAILEFANSLVDLHGVEIDPNAGTKIKVRAIFDAQPEIPTGVRDYVGKLLDYWRAVSDLAQRQEHAASREKRPLGVDDARRLVFQTLVVMAEIDSALQSA